MNGAQLLNNMSIQVCVAGEAPYWQIAETEGHTMISFTKMLEHMSVHKSAAEHVFTWQTQPVFIRMLAPVAGSIRGWNVGEIRG